MCGTIIIVSALKSGCYNHNSEYIEVWVLQL